MHKIKVFEIIKNLYLFFQMQYLINWEVARSNESVYDGIRQRGSIMKTHEKFLVPKSLFAKDALVFLGNNLHCERVDRSIKLDEAAEATGIDREQIDRIEIGQYLGEEEVNIVPLLKLIQYYNQKLLFNVDLWGDGSGLQQ